MYSGGTFATEYVIKLLYLQKIFCVIKGEWVAGLVAAYDKY